MDHNQSALSQALIRAGARLDALGLVPARDGNLSARLGNGALVTQSATRKGELTPEDLVVVDAAGQPLETAGRPSTELGLHLALYRLRPDVHAVVHAHPPIATGFACAGRDLTRPLMPEAVVHLGPVPLVPYATPGTSALEAAAGPAAAKSKGFLLANHGAVTVGATVDEALERMETLEHLARITLVANLLGGAIPLRDEDLTPLLALARAPRSR